MFRGYVALNDTEKRDLLQEIRKYDRLDESEQYERHREIQKIDLGPLSQGGCPCCGS